MIKKSMKETFYVKVDDLGNPTSINLKILDTQSDYEISNIVTEDKTKVFYVTPDVLDGYLASSIFIKFKKNNRTMFSIMEADCSVSRQGDIRFIMNDFSREMVTIFIDENGSPCGFIDKDVTINGGYSEFKHRLVPFIGETIDCIIKSADTISLEKMSIFDNKFLIRKTARCKNTETFIEALTKIKSKNMNLYYPSLHSSISIATNRDVVIWNKRGNNYKNDPFASRISTLKYDGRRSKLYAI